MFHLQVFHKGTDFNFGQFRISEEKAPASYKFSQDLSPHKMHMDKTLQFKTVAGCRE